MRSVVSESKPAEAAASDPAAASGQPQAQVQQVQQVQVQQVQPSQTSSSSGASASSQDSGKGGSKGPAAPSKGKGAKGAKGKGKGVPPLPVAKGKGKAQPKASANALPFGKRLNMRDSGALPQTARGEQPSIFQGLFAKRAGHAQEDIDTLCSLFSESKASASTAQAAPVQGNVSKAAPRKILPDEKARNCAIVLRGLPLRGPDLVEAVRLLEPGPLEQDHLERLAVIMPEPKVMSEIQSAGEDGLAPLRDVERAMVPFSQLGRLQERLKALILAANLQGQELRLMGQMQVVKAACKQIGESSSLKHVLATVLVMYNYVNFGQVGRSHAHAFDIANLLHLNEFRADRGAPAPFPKFSALHYVAMRLLADESVQSIRTLKTELGRVSEAAGVCLQHVATSIEQLNKDIEKLREEQRANASVYGGAVEEPAPPSPEHAPPATPPVARRLTELSEVSECEEITPRVDLVPQQTPRCGARAVTWLRQAMGQMGPAELGDLARGAPQQCPSSAWLMLNDGTRMRKVYVTLSELGVLCYAESMASPESVRCLPVIGAKVCHAQAPNSFQISCLEKPGCGSEMVYSFQAPDLQASLMWQEALRAASVQKGAGWLEVRSAFSWKCRWVVVLTVHPSHSSRSASRFSAGSRSSLCVGSRWLLWSCSPEDMLVGEICGSVELGSTEVFNRNCRAHSFRVGYLQHSRGGEALSNLSLRARSEAEVDRWVECIRCSQPSQPTPPPVVDTPSCSREPISHRSSECSISSPGSVGQRVFVPRLNLGACSRLESARSSQSKATASTAASTPSPQKETRKTKKRGQPRETLWTEIHRDIITPRPGMARAPRISEAQCDGSSSEETDSGSEGTQETTSEPAAEPVEPPCRSGAASDDLLVTARRPLNADVSTYERMTALADEAEGSAQRMATSLTETLEEGRQLLVFLGQKPPEITSSETAPAELGGSVRGVFDTVSKFVGLLEGAVADVEKFQRGTDGRSSAVASSVSSANYGFHRRRKRAVTETEQCKQLARDSILRAISRACKVDMPVKAAAKRVARRVTVPSLLASSSSPPRHEVKKAATTSFAFDELD
ncbi:FH3 [Symbiodinium pilosum]|uniref:FH3 protein n=1 Tax=Symbiodinium pilosum TaxID=2952 RepID=A0A812QPD2_SYMPI|nr:FH3 [Symbiodinium pilosum]